MGYEDRIRKGLKKAGINGNPWIELLALSMMPDPGHDLSGKSRIWKFSCPKWMTVDVITGIRPLRHHFCRIVDLGQPGFLRIEGHHMKHWKIQVVRITGITLSFQHQPESFYKNNIKRGKGHGQP